MESIEYYHLCHVNIHAHKTAIYTLWELIQKDKHQTLECFYRFCGIQVERKSDLGAKR